MLCRADTHAHLSRIEGHGTALWARWILGDDSAYLDAGRWVKAVGGGGGVCRRERMMVM